jgi:hypothetical protein
LLRLTVCRKKLPFVHGCLIQVLIVVKKDTAKHQDENILERGVNMNGFTNTGFYELIYKNERFSFLQYIRKDVICDVCYITLKNVITGETMTFDKSEVRGLRIAGEEATAS